MSQFTYDTMYLLRQCKLCKGELNYRELKAMENAENPVCFTCAPWLDKPAS